MGRQKLLEPIEGRSMIRRAVEAAARWPTVVVASDAVAAELAGTAVQIVRNDEPERGMTRSLQLADGAIGAGEPIAVMLGDLPDCDAAAIARVVEAYGPDTDVVVPRAGARFGHPVVFGPNARRKIPTLPEGDTLQQLRGDETLRRRIIEVPDARAFVDIDTDADLAERRSAR